MKYFLACGLAALALGGCVHDNPFYVDPTGASSSTSEDSAITAGDPSTSVATSEESTGDPDTGDDTSDDTTSVGTSSTSDATSGAATMDTGDDTGDTTMPAAVCGDGNIDPDEVCDDGNDNNDDECTVACLPPPSLEGFFPSGSSELLGYEGPYQAPGLCPGLLRGISIAANEEIGILQVKLFCHDFKFVSIGEGAFEVVRTGGVLYADYIGPEGNLVDSWAPECPEDSPALVGVGGWAHQSEMTKLELHCVKLVLVPEQGSYKLIYENPQGPTEGYNDWGKYQAPVGCEEFPGTFAADLIVHTSDSGVTGISVLCSEPDFGL